MDGKFCLSQHLQFGCVGNSCDCRTVGTFNYHNFSNFIATDEKTKCNFYGAFCAAITSNQYHCEHLFDDEFTLLCMDTIWYLDYIR